MRIAVDAMGGDFAPQATVEGACRAVAEESELERLFLVGDQAQVEAVAAGLSYPRDRVEIVHAEEVVGMDESPITPIRRKRRSSIRLCANLVREGRADALMTAGNTGAGMIAAKMVIGTVEGVDRPALAAVFPNWSEEGRHVGRTVVLDVGANVDSKPAQLRQFAVMGHFYAQEVLGKPAPTVGLLSVGEEESKGSDLTKEVFKVMQTTGLNFVGNVEGRDVFNAKVDVIVCDGFVGNAILKSAESMASLLTGVLRAELERSWRTRLGYLFAKPALVELRELTDYREYGGAPLLGLKGGCFIGHGSSDAMAIHSAVRRAVEFCRAGVDDKIREKVAMLHEQEKRLLGGASTQEATAS